MKKILISLFLLFTVFSWAEDIQLKNGTTVKGTIIEENEISYFVKIETGILEVSKENVVNIEEYIDFSVSEKTAEIQPEIANTKPVASFKDLKNDPNYFAYRHYFLIGLGFLIPGLSLTMTPLLFTPAVVNALVSNKTPVIDIIYPTSLYFSCIGVGLILNIISIPLFYLANQYYQKALEKYRVSVDVREDNLEISMNVSF